MGPRGDCIVQLDWCVGELMKTLDRCGIADNTLIVFCSDNGPVLDDGYKDDAVEKLGDHHPAARIAAVSTVSGKVGHAHRSSRAGKAGSHRRYPIKWSAPSTLRRASRH